MTRLQTRLDGVTWKDNSLALALDPELETWLRHDTRAVANYLNVSGASLPSGTDPKNWLETAFYSRLQRNPRPKDYERIARLADLTLWRTDASFDRLVMTLQEWFGS